MRQRTIFVAGIVVLALLTITLAAADLQPQTVAGFDRYVRATEAQMVPSRFYESTVSRTSNGVLRSPH